MPNDINIQNGESVYFHVEPYSAGKIGTYLLDILIKRNSITSIESIGTSNTLKVSPNPTTEELRIAGVETDNYPSLQIYDIVGRLLQSKIINSPFEEDRGMSEITIDVSRLASGMYYLKIADKTLKFIKE
jgi:hypothetical protein